jgi:flavorubredoxin
MNKPNQITPEITVLPSHVPVLNMGFLAVNAFVIKAKEPVLIDTGLGSERDAFLKGLSSVIDPRDIKWIWLTHDDSDHIGNIRQVMDAAPNARIVANALATIRMNAQRPLPMNRCYWINSGESLSVGDRTLTAVRPPLFDNPTTIGIHDSKSGAFFSADCFGAIVPSPVPDADDLAPEDLARGMAGWESADSPWAHMVQAGPFAQALDSVRKLEPKMILSSHLAPARGKTEQFLEILASVPSLDPFVPPNQPVLEQVLAEARGGDK